jgi:hypothetical protein
LLELSAVILGPGFSLSMLFSGTPKLKRLMLAHFSDLNNSLPDTAQVEILYLKYYICLLNINAMLFL